MAEFIKTFFGVGKNENKFSDKNENKFFFAGKDENLNYYQLLGVSEKATTDEINKAYYERMRAYHPDKNQHGEAMTRLFTKAKKTLTDPQKKAIYDGQMYNYATMDHEEPMDYAVVDPVFPKFGDVLEMNKCEGLTKKMEQLTVNAVVAHGVLSKEDKNSLASINQNLEDVGLNNMMDAFIKALGSKFICNKCKKQLELDDICYCNDAKNKCHCNSRTCCTVTLKERGKFK
uniref:J domain-containing protein n=1 Tax=Globodera rostochiensis TaxID=31243 RepID=A0A914HRS8_GLORO